jgi:hypothetical protein
MRGVLLAALLLFAAAANGQIAFRAASQATLAATTGGTITHIGAGAAAIDDAGCPRTASPAIPAGNVNDLLIALAVAREDSATVNVSAGWNTLYAATYAPAGQEMRAFIYYRFATNTAADNITVTESGTCSSLVARVSRFRNVDTAQPFVTSPIAANGAQVSMQNANAISSGAETPDLGNSMLLVASFVVDDNPVTEGAGWSASFESPHNVARDLALNLHYQLQNDAAAAQASGWAMGATDENIGVIFALRPLPGNVLSIPFPPGTQAGDVMVASVTASPNVAIGAPPGWTAINSTAQAAGSGSRLASYYRVATGSEPASYPFSFAGAAAGVAGGIVSFSGVDAANPIDAAGANTTASGLTHTANAIATTVTNTMLVGSFEFASSPAAANWAPTGMTEVVDAASGPRPSNGGVALAIGYVLRGPLGSTGAWSATASGVTADTGAAHLVALRGTPNVVFDVLSGDYALACAAFPAEVTIVARDTNGNVQPAYASLVNISTSTGTGDWSVGTASGVLNNGAANDGAATYQFVAADSGRIVLRLAVGAVSTVTVTVQDAATGFSSSGIPINFIADSYRIVPDPIQVAGRPQLITVERRVAPGCGLAAGAGHGGNNAAKIWLSLDPSHPGPAALPGATGVTVVDPLPAAEPGANNITLGFAGGVATFQLTSTDVGKYRINIRDTNTARRGVSPAITTRPFGLALPGVSHSANETSAPVIAAGADFALSVGAYLWSNADDADDDGVPDAGANITDNGATPAFAWNTVLSVPPGQILPAGGTDGVLSFGGVVPATVSTGSYVNGIAALNNARYSEVGSAFVVANATGFLDTPGATVTGNSGLDGTGAAGGYVGRFRPNHFALSGGALTNRVALGCGSAFTYMDEGLQLGFTLTAQNAQNGTTLNYTGVYAKLGTTTFANWNVGARSGTTNLTARVDGAVAPTGNWSNGVANMLVTTGIRRPSPPPNDDPDGPYPGLAFGIAPVDADGTAMNTLDLDVNNDAANDRRSVGATTEARYGRLRMQNALGSEKVTLPVRIETQYWNGAAFALNAADGCTAVPRSAIALDFTGSALAACQTAVNQATVSFAGGVGALTLAPPAPNKGSVLLRVNLGGAAGNYCTGVGGSYDPAGAVAMPYLLGRWDDAADPDANPNTAYDDKPAARATFGLYGSQPDSFIFFRENF